MNFVRAALFAFGSLAVLASCGPTTQNPETSPCLHIGQRLHSLPIHGAIFSSGTAHRSDKAYIAGCPDGQVSVLFLREPPSEFRQLRARSDQTGEIIGFAGVADGYIVKDSPEDLILVVITMNGVQEDRTITLKAKEI
jgi:hypothetical protein